jgi:hypothetical protein
MARFQADRPTGAAVLQLEVLVRTALFKSATQTVGYLLQAAADQVDAAYQAKPGWERKGRQPVSVAGIFGSFRLERDYYYHPGKQRGHFPADAALGLEQGCTPALARLICLEGADENSYQKAEDHLRETGGIEVSARQVQRLVQPVGAAAQQWQERQALVPEPQSQAVPVMYVSADATGVPMRQAELVGRAGKQPDGTAKTRMAYLGCVFTQHQTDAKGHPLRDYQSTTYVSSFNSIDAFGPALRQEAIRRGLALATQVVLLIDGANALAHMGRLCFPGVLQIVDYYHALEHAGKVWVALLGSKEHPDYQGRLSRWAGSCSRTRWNSSLPRRGGKAPEGPAPRPWKRNWLTSSTTWSGCAMGAFAAKGSSLAQGWWKPAARPSLERAANNRGCSGAVREPRTCSPCAVSAAATGWISSGKTGSMLTPPVTTACGSPPNEEFCLTPRDSLEQ